MARNRRRKIYHVLFLIGIALKGLDGVLEVIGGVVFFFVSQSDLNHFVALIMQQNWIDDPHDRIAYALHDMVNHMSLNTHVFASAYLLGHGVIKIGLVAGMLRHKLWAYPTAMSFLGLFILYQMYRFSHTYSVLLLGLTGIDLAVMILIGIEYRGQLAEHRGKGDDTDVEAAS